MLLPFRHSSIRVRLLLASTVVQVVLLSLLLANSMRLMNNAVSASLDTTITQNAMRNSRTSVNANSTKNAPISKLLLIKSSRPCR